MNQARTLELLSQHKTHLARRYGVTGLALFGSTVRGDAREDSDIDIPGWLRWATPPPSVIFGVQFYLEDLLGRPVDLVTERALRPELRPYVESEAIRV